MLNILFFEGVHDIRFMLPVLQTQIQHVTGKNASVMIAFNETEFCARLPYANLVIADAGLVSKANPVSLLALKALREALVLTGWTSAEEKLAQQLDLGYLSKTQCFDAETFPQETFRAILRKAVARQETQVSWLAKTHLSV
jgi:hypothetical protein